MFLIVRLSFERLGLRCVVLLSTPIVGFARREIAYYQYAFPRSI